MAAAMCSVEPREPPPHFTLPGSFFMASITSFMVLKGELAGSTKTLYSLVRRAMGVAWVRLTGGWPVMMPPSITAPMTISAFGSLLLALTNWARPRAPAAPPLFSKLTDEAMPPSCKALPKARPVVSQPPPGLAGIIIFRAGPAARADSGRPEVAARAARDFRKVSRRTVSPSFGIGCRDLPDGGCQMAVGSIGVNTRVDGALWWR